MHRRNELAKELVEKILDMERSGGFVTQSTIYICCIWRVGCSRDTKEGDEEGKCLYEA